MNRQLVLIVAIVVAACGKEPETESRVELPAESLPGVYAGVFPCEDCPGIATTLWLRSDTRFFIRQEYAGTEDREAMTAYNFGRWNWDAPGQVLVLSGDGPNRRFTRPDEHSLLMQTSAAGEHRLDRDPAAPAFVAMTRMSGTIRLGDDGAVFRECLTQLEAPVSRGGDYRKFLHQLRSAGGSRNAVSVELEGRFDWGEDAAPRSYQIDRFFTIKPGAGC